MTFPYESFYKTHLKNLKEEGIYRTFLEVERPVAAFPQAFYRQGAIRQEITVWCSNDYLGMGQHPEVLRAMAQALTLHGAGAGGTRNLSGTSPYHVELEKELADLHQKEAALLFNSCYAANDAALSTLGKHLPDCVIFSDALNHASLIQGIRHSKAEKYVFRHNDPTDLKKALEKVELKRPKVLVFESLYSMEGDFAPLKKFIALAKKYQALTFVDEVHAVGLYGKRGGGYLEEQNLLKEIDLISGTLGKAYGVMGGYLAGSQALIDFIRSFAAPFIFSTALAPVLAAGALKSVKHLKESTLERDAQRKKVQLLKAKLKEAAIPFLNGGSHIVPVMVKGAHACQEVSQILLKEYFIYAQAVFYPTVPRDQARLRLVVHPKHTEEMITHLVAALKEIWQRLNLSDFSKLTG